MHKNSLFKLFSLMFSVFLLSGCTMFLWNKNPEAVVIADDKLVAISKIQKENEERLIMLGEQYWLLLDKTSSEQFAPLFQTKFSRPFVLGTNNEIEFNIQANHLAAREPHISRFSRKSFAIQLENVNSKQFKGMVSLRYQHATDNEEAILAKICHPKFKEVFYCDFQFSGEIYQKTEQSLNLHTAKIAPALPMTIFYESTERSLGEISKNLILTPFTLVGDMIALPVIFVGSIVK